MRKALAQYALIYLAGSMTLFQIVLALFVNGRSPAILRYLAPICGALGLLFIIWPFYTLQRHGGVASGSSYLATTQVVARGPYAIVRHPQYLGYICLNLTFMLIAPQGLILLLGLAASTCFYLQALREEKDLLQKFGQAYRVYMRRVPRFNLLLGLARAADRSQILSNTKKEDK